MDMRYIIQRALAEYDENRPIMGYLEKNTNMVLETVDYGTKRDICKFYNKDDNKLVFESESEILGTYYAHSNIWIWSWANVNLRTPESYLTKELLQYGLKLEPNENFYMKSLLTTSRGIINDKIQLDIILALASYFIKYKYVYAHAEHKKEEDISVVIYYILVHKEKITI